MQLNTAELILEQEGVFGKVSVDQIPLEFLMLDEDILSFEMPDFFKSFFLVRLAMFPMIIDNRKYMIRSNKRAVIYVLCSCIVAGWRPDIGAPGCKFSMFAAASFWAVQEYLWAGKMCKGEHCTSITDESCLRPFFFTDGIV